MTRWTSCTATSNSRCSTPTTTSAASCRSTSMTRQRAGRSLCCCAPGKTPSGTEVRGHLRRLVHRIRRHWPQTRITIRGDGHYGRLQVMQWCEENGVDFVCGLPGTPVLDRLVDVTADDIRSRRVLDQKRCL